MSKVYSFRLDVNNPREAQAKEVINAWVSKGYSLRIILTNALIQYGNNNDHSKDMDILLEKIKDLVRNSDRMQISEDVDLGGKEVLQTQFIKELSNSIKPGLKA